MLQYQVWGGRILELQKPCFEVEEDPLKIRFGGGRISGTPVPCIAMAGAVP